MNRLRLARQIAHGILAALLLAACTGNELTDGNPHGTPLPEGRYPLMLTATQNEVVASPQTRVSDYEEGRNHKSRWTTGDQIKVAVSEGGNNMETTCTLDENGSITIYNPQLYWKTIQSSKINAWYSNIAGAGATTSSTVGLSDQSSGLVYVMKANETIINYKSKNISLNFKHQLAKVRVKLEKGTYEGDLSNAIVKMKGCYTSCTVSNGAVTGNGTTGDITMCKTTSGSDTYYEANTVPSTALKDNAFESSVGGKTTIANLTSEITLAAGNVYKIAITMNAAGPTTYPAGNTIPEIKDNGEYIIEGDGTGGDTNRGTIKIIASDGTFTDNGSGYIDN